MSAKVPTRSILKQKTPKSKADEDAEKAAKDKRNLSIALNHANRIELQKKVQSQIVKNIETLLDLPIYSRISDPASPTSPSKPKARDCQTFTNLVHLFQPSDFASLIEERRINGSCGYALCANAPRSETLGASASWKLKGKGEGDFCSRECVRRALYVKAQLSETPAWERQPGQQDMIFLPPEDRLDGGDRGGDARVEVSATQSVANGRDLAAERGETSTSFKPRQVMMDFVVEKSRSSPTPSPAFPSRPSSGPEGGAIEGYESKFLHNRHDDSDSAGDEDDSAKAQAAGFSSELRDAYEDDAFNEEEEAAWLEMQAGLQHLNTGHDR